MGRGALPCALAILVLGCAKESTPDASLEVQRSPSLAQIKGATQGVGSGKQRRGDTDQLLFASGFERGLEHFDMGWLRVKSAVSITKRFHRAGAHGLHVTLSRNQLMYSKGKRSELALPVGFEQGSAYWYGISILLPKRWKEDTKGEVLVQWFARRDKELGEKGRSPALAIRTKGKKWYVTQRWDHRPLTPHNSGKKGTLFSSPFQRGVWTDWAFFVRWSHQEDGEVRVYMNQKLVAQRRGPSTYNDRRGPIMKFGIYKPPWNTPQTPSAVSFREAYFDEVYAARGEAGLWGVSPKRPQKTGTQ